MEIQMSRSKGDQAFRRVEVLRLIRAAEESGASRFSIECAGGYTLKIDKSKTVPTKDEISETTEGKLKSLI
jgi:hypothetical protein